MNDLVTIADHDFRMVNYTSILVIFVIMVLVLKQINDFKESQKKRLEKKLNKKEKLR